MRGYLIRKWEKPSLITDRTNLDVNLGSSSVLGADCQKRPPGGSKSLSICYRFSTVLGLECFLS